jgi:lipopolysaccharide transport system ATP-binding protein
MSQVVLSVENVSKMYQLGNVGTKTLSQDINRWWHTVRGKEDPYSKIGEVNDRSVKGDGDFVWALQNISFDVCQGDTLGIVGRNGAGKSTLIKILSRVAMPNTGHVKIKGRITSLLEVGTGFHPELTGRENIFLNGAILGMRKREIQQKLDAIIDFSGVSRYADTPVKRYSSGMYVRLAFAVAAYLEPEILVVDEVLAVGDAEFQKKCLGKMKDVSGEGRTVLFVSHNMAAVKSLCKTGILLKNGQLVKTGTSDQVVSTYLMGDSELHNDRVFYPPMLAQDVAVHSISVYQLGKTSKDLIVEGQPLQINLKFTIQNQAVDRYHMTFHLSNDDGEPVFSFSHLRDGTALRNGENELVCTFPPNFLNVGNFYLSLYVIKDKKEAIMIEKDIASFTISVKDTELGTWMGREPGDIKPSFEWVNIPS